MLRQPNPIPQLVVQQLVVLQRVVHQLAVLLQGPPRFQLQRVVHQLGGAVAHPLVAHLRSSRGCRQIHCGTNRIRLVWTCGAAVFLTTSSVSTRISPCWSHPLRTKRSAAWPPSRKPSSQKSSRDTCSVTARCLRCSACQELC